MPCFTDFGKVDTKIGIAMNEKRYSDLVADFKQLFPAVGELNDAILRAALMVYLAQWLATATETEGLPKETFMRDVSGSERAQGLAESINPLLSDLLEVVRLRNPGVSEALKNAFIKSTELQEAADRYLIAEMLYCDGVADEAYRETRKRGFLDSFAATDAHRFQAEGPIVHAIQTFARHLADARLAASVKGRINAN